METTNVKMKLTTFAETPFGVFSYLTCGDMTLVTVELNHDSENLDESCIPAGIYDVGRIIENDKADQWQVLNVRDRVGIYIMRGNLGVEPKGNIWPGLELGCLNHEWGVRDTPEAMEVLQEVLKDVGIFRLYIDRSMMGQDMNKNDRTL